MEEKAGQKPEVRVIPESDLIAYKEASKGREAKLKAQLEDFKNQLQALSSELEIAKASSGSDEDVVKVREHLLQQAKEYDAKVKKHEKEVASVSERERKARARELVADYKEQGVTLTQEELLDAEDMELFVIQKRADHLAEENAKLKAKPPETTQNTSQVFETGAVSTKTKQPKDMTPAEFDTYVKEQREKALSRVS